MTTSTERLRALLDERGVRWSEVTPSKTKWYSPVLNGPVAVSEWNDKLVLDAGYVNVTPEQAIAATLGSEREAELEALAKDLFENATDFAFKGWLPYYKERFAALGIEVGE